MYSYNQFLPSSYSNSIYFSTYYKKDGLNFSSRLAKTNNMYYLDNLLITLPVKDKSLSVFDISFYPTLPFSSSFYARGIEFVDKKYKIIIGKERDTGSLPPSFKESEYISSGEWTFYNRFPVEFKTSFFAKKNTGKSPVFLLSNNFAYSRDKINFEKRLGFSILNSSIGIADEMRLSFLKEERGFNFIFRGKTENYSLFYESSKHHYIGLSGAGFSKISPYIKGISRAYYYNSSLSWMFSNDYEINFIYPSFPGISISGGIEGSRKFVFKRGVELFYNQRFGYLRVSHSKGLREINDIRVEFRKYPLSLSAYSVFSKTRVYKISFGVLPRKFISLEGYLGRESRETNRNFYGFNIRFLKPGINFLASYYTTKLGERFYSTLSFSLSGTVTIQKMGLSKCYGFIFMDENGNFEYDAGEKPVEGIKLILDGTEEVYTDKRGRFNISFLPAGKHKLEIKYGALPAQYGSGFGETFEFNTGFVDVKKFSIPLVPLGEVKGIVFIDKNRNGQKDEDEESVKNAVVLINGSSTITDEEGVFYITALPPGIYNVEIGSVPVKGIRIPPVFSIIVNPGEKIYGINLPVYLPEKKVRYKKF